MWTNQIARFKPTMQLLSKMLTLGRSGYKRVCTGMGKPQNFTFARQRERRSFCRATLSFCSMTGAEEDGRLGARNGDFCERYGYLAGHERHCLALRGFSSTQTGQREPFYDHTHASKQKQTLAPSLAPSCERALGRVVLCKQRGWQLAEQSPLQAIHTKHPWT